MRDNIWDNYNRLHTHYLSTVNSVFLLKSINFWQIPPDGLHTWHIFVLQFLWYHSNSNQLITKEVSSNSVVSIKFKLWKFNGKLLLEVTKILQSIRKITIWRNKCPGRLFHHLLSEDRNSNTSVLTTRVQT